MTPHASCGDSNSTLSAYLEKKEMDLERRRMLRVEREKCLEAAKLGGVRRFRARLRKISGLEAKFAAGGFEGLHCEYLKSLAVEKNAAERLLLREEILFLDVFLVHEVSLGARTPSGGLYQWDRAFLRDFDHARNEILAQSLTEAERMRFLVDLTLAYLNYDWLRSHSEKELELLALEQRRGLEKLAYMTITRIVASVIGREGSPVEFYDCVAQDIKVFYHCAFDAASRERLEALGRPDDLASLIRDSFGANELKRKCRGAAPQEAFRQYLLAAELYGRLGLESEILACLRSAKSLISQLENSCRSQAYLIIEQKQQEFLGLASG